MVGPGYFAREKQKFPLDHLLEFVSEKPSVKKCTKQISSKNIHKGNSLRDVLHKSVSLVCKGDHGRQVREKSDLEGTQMLLMDHWQQKGECNFQFLNLIIC